MSMSSPVADESFVSYLEKLFTLSLNDINVMITDFHVEMKRGLSGYESSLKMIPSFADSPKGNEEGRFIALDLGGTNFRVLAVELDGMGNARVLAARKFAIRKKEMHGTGAQLFDFITDRMDAFLSENEPDRENIHDLAFTFSFPVEQTNIAAGKLIAWTKGFTAKGVEGEDIIMLLNEALRRKNIHCINVVALANDTVGTLVAKSYADPACDLGVILGTGTNACYLEKLSNIQKLGIPDHEGHMIVNMEWGNFDRLRRTCYDKQLDAASVNPGAMYFEKMVSGMYLGEITRLILIDVIKKNLILPNTPGAANRFEKKDSLETAHMSLIEGDETPHLDEVKEFFNNNGISNNTFHDRTILKRLCGLVSDRGARLGAAAISAVITWMDPELNNMHTVGIDGSLFEKYPGFGAKMTDVFKKRYGQKAEKITLALSKDGSGKGAAIIAAVAAASEVKNPGPEGRIHRD
jgi:hexokinase